MPSPFPGMDPYLEDPPTWGNFHLNMIAEIQAELNRQLRPKYYARAEERVYISDQDDPGRRVIVPDILIEDDIHEFRVEVIDTALRKVVTVIEVLSPTNKVPGARGQDSYRRKRTEVMCSPSHWVEIDLLRDGATLVAGEVLPKGDYFVHVSRVETRPSGSIWPIRLPQRLPVIPIPLRAPDPDAKLDLQAILNTIYDRSAYDLDLDYRKDPVPPLPPDYAAWAARLLKEKGLR